MTKRSILEIKNIPNKLTNWLVDTIENNGCKVERIEWQSKYNSYVVYDYEPTCTEGFIITILYSGPSLQHCKFIEYLYNKRIENIETFKKMWGLPSARKTFFQERREQGALMFYARKN